MPLVVDHRPDRLLGADYPQTQRPNLTAPTSWQWQGTGNMTEGAAWTTTSGTTAAANYYAAGDILTNQTSKET